MKKCAKIIISLCLALMIATCYITYAQDGILSIIANVDYDTGVIDIHCKTLAYYNQRISVVMHKEELSEITSVRDYARIDEVIADESGNANVTFAMNDNDDSGRYVISASGGGYLSQDSKAEIVIEFVNPSDIKTKVIGYFNNADINTIETYLKQYKDVLGITVSNDYETDKAEINQIFLDIRKYDYNDNFKSTKDIKYAVDFVDVVRKMKKATEASVINTLILNNTELLEIDVTNTDYSESPMDVCSVFVNLNKDTPIKALSDITQMFNQSVAINAINSSDVVTLKEKLTKYAKIIGVDLKDYDKYDYVKVNAALKDKNFKNVFEIKNAYDARIAELAGQNKTFSGGGGGGSIGKVINTIVGQPQEQTENIKKNNFSDIEEEPWAKESIIALTEMNIINGNGNGTFKPKDKVTREQFVKMLVLAFDIFDKDSICNFADVNENEWYYLYISSANQKGILKGYEDNTVGIGQKITRQDMAVMIKRISDLFSIVYKEKNESTNFVDVDEISEYAKENVLQLQRSGILNGLDDGRFAPKDYLSRAEAAKVVYEIMINK